MPGTRVKIGLLCCDAEMIALKIEAKLATSITCLTHFAKHSKHLMFISPCAVDYSRKTSDLFVFSCQHRHKDKVATLFFGDMAILVLFDAHHFLTVIVADGNDHNAAGF